MNVTRRRSNCLIFALAHWWRDGGYLIIRRSEYWGKGFGLHFLWSPNLVTFEEFTPVRAKARRICPPILFIGFVRDGAR
jgi:hypothetical protein